MSLPLYQPQSGLLTVQYEPNEHTELLENPPRFTWMPAQYEEDRYELQISTDESFSTEHTLTYGPIPYNLFTPDQALSPGIYYWRYALKSELERSEWSQIRRFSVPEGLPETKLPSRKERYASVSNSHPRLWLQASELEAFTKKVHEDPTYCGWSEFFEKSVKVWLERPLIAEPKPYPENKRVAKLWRQMYMDCQESLYAIRHLAIAGVVLNDREILDRAKTWLLHVASWNPEGTTARDYNDEAAFRIAGALAWGYDWLYHELSEEERRDVREVLLKRTTQVAFHVIERSRIHQVPYDSHAVRSLSSVLVTCCISMFGEEQQAEEWLDYTLEYFACVYTPWGGRDGGWAEGPMYWTTGMAFLLEALNLVRKYTGIDFYKRPFFSKTGDYPLYCFSPETLRASFGDQSTLGDTVSLKTGFNIRQYAGITGNGLYQWYFEQVKQRDTDSEMKFYNYGWWDFRFDDMVYQFDYPAITPVVPTPERIEAVKWFRDIGWVAMHHRMDDPDEHIMLLTKSSRYGSISHSHGDQNAFLLHAYGEPLAIESGYYVAFGSTMHRNWRRQTRSKNTILIDGKGQYAGTDKALNMAAYGTIEAAEQRPGCGYVRMNATAAYQEEFPYLKNYTREIYFFDNAYFVVVDLVDLNQSGSIDWQFHTLHPMTLKGQSFKLEGAKAGLEGRFIYSSSGDLSLRQTNEFQDVDPSEIEGLAKHWHLNATTRNATSHRLATLLVPFKQGTSKYVSCFMDDQDHGIHIYFTDQGITRKVEIPKAY
jgi:hypothetical protein